MEGIRYPAPVTEAIDQLRAAGYPAYAVGGCVRDSLLGKSPKDWDIATAAWPEETRRVFSGCPIIATGERHGTLTVIVAGMPLEITAFRTEGHYSDGRHPDQVAFSRSLEEDLARRDFTVNALAAAPGEPVSDLFGGIRDLEAGVIRCVGNPKERFGEDALRIPRALRFASVLGFSLEEGTAACLREQRGLLAQVSQERVTAELLKLLCGKSVLPVLLDFPEVFGAIIPELAPLVGFDQRTSYHCWDIYGHTARAVAAIPPEPELRLTMLLHDIGKPARFFIGPGGRGHFKGHAAAGWEMAGKILSRMKLPGASAKRILPLILYHDSGIPSTEEGVRFWLSHLGKARFFDLLAVKRADNLAKNPDCAKRIEKFDALERLAKEILRRGDCLSLKELAVRGENLNADGFSGKAVGQLLDILLDAVVKGRCPNEKEALLALAEKSWLPPELNLSATPRFSFRRARTKEEARAAGEIYRAVTEAISRNPDDPCRGWITGEYPTLETAAEALGRGELFLLYGDGQPVGTVILNHSQPPAYAGADWQFPGEGALVIHTFAIHPEARGRGLGRIMLDFCEEQGRKNGCPAVRLDTLAFNYPAIRLYEGAGYRYAGTVDLGLNIPGVQWFRTYEKKL